MELVRPSVEYKDSFIEAVKEYQAETQPKSTPLRYAHVPLAELEADFASFVSKELSHAEGENLPAGFLPQYEYWLVDAGAYIGSVRIRPTLNDHLLKFGGHVGYDIRPSARGKGYGNEILALALPKAKELDLQRVLLTCDVTNQRSRKVIEKNGGVLENEVENPPTGVNKLRFWINL